MSLRHAHVPTERLAALAMAGTHDEPGAQRSGDSDALAHVSACHQCSTELSRLISEIDVLRDEAFDEVDALFPEPVLEAQRTRILGRLAHVGHAARVLRFPIRAVAARHVRPVVNNRRWVSAAAVAGLLIGLVTGQVVHLSPWDRTRHLTDTRNNTPVQVQASLPLRAGIVPIAASASLTDYVTLTDVDSAVQLRRAADVLAFDLLTPVNDVP